jgi:hypothetical protein
VVSLMLWRVLAGTAASQVPNVADGPWSGQIQCVLSARGSNYQDDQTHTWRLTGEPPKVAGSVRLWPAVWSVQGKGQRLLSTQTRTGAAVLGGPSESWTTVVPDTSAPIAIYEFPGTGTFRIHSQHTQGYADGAIQVSASSGATSASRAWEWTVPSIVEDVQKKTISGSRTATVTNGPGWRRPAEVATTETCTWNLTRAPIESPTLALTWTGSARCNVVADGGTEYREQMMHVWTISGAARKIQGTTETYDATWSVTGDGRNEGLWHKAATDIFTASPQKYTSNWKTSVPPMNSQLTIDANKGQVAVIAPPTRLKSAASAVTGQKSYSIVTYPPSCAGFGSLGNPSCYANSTQAIGFAVDEWEFPKIESKTAGPRVSGSRTAPSARPISPMQPSTVVPTASCAWDFIQVGR